MTVIGCAVSLSQFWLRLTGRRNKAAGVFVELIEMTFSSTKKKDDDDAGSAQNHYRTSRVDGTRIGGVLAGPSDHGLSPAKGTQAARIQGRRRLAFQTRSDRAMDDRRTETKLICLPRDPTAPSRDLCRRIGNSADMRRRVRPERDNAIAGGAPKTTGREGSLGRDAQMDGRRKIFGWTYQWRRFWRRWQTVILLVMLAVLLGIWLALLQSR